MLDQAKTKLADWLSLAAKDRDAFGSKLESYMRHFWSEVDKPETVPKKTRIELQNLLRDLDGLRRLLTELDDAALSELNAAKRLLSETGVENPETSQSREYIHLSFQTRSVRDIKQALESDLALLASYTLTALDEAKRKVKPGRVEDSAKALLVTIAASLCSQFIGARIESKDYNRSPLDEGPVFDGDVHAFALALFNAFQVQITPDSLSHNLRALKRN